MERYWTLRPANAWRIAEVFPRAPGPFIRASGDMPAERERVIGQWGLIPWFAKTPKLTYSTNNARFEEVGTKASYKQAWAQGKRCIIPAVTFDEPNWQTGKNVWWRFRRADGGLWGLAGLWNAWTDRSTGEVFESYTMLTLNADACPLMSRMHKPDPKLGPDQQDKRSVVAIEREDVDTWLRGSAEDAAALVRFAAIAQYAAGPVQPAPAGDLLGGAPR